MKLPMAVPALFLVSSIGCGTSPTDPAKEEESPSFPVIVPVGSSCGANRSATYYVWGLSNNVRDAQTVPLAAVVKVGETVRLSIDFEGCGSNTAEAWTSTDPAVATVVQDSQLSAVARLTGLMPGDTRVFVDFQGPHRQRHRTYPAYCPTSIFVCLSPRTPIALVRVVSP